MGKMERRGESPDDLAAEGGQVDEVSQEPAEPGWPRGNWKK